MKKRASALLLLIVIVSVSLLFVGCTKGSSEPSTSITGAATLQDLEGKEIAAEGGHTLLNPDTGTPSAPVGSAKGFTAPDFTITTTDGKTVQLSKLIADKPVLLYFWATWCPFCKGDLAVANNVYPKYKDKVAFLAIDLDPKESVELISRYKVSGKHDLMDFTPADVKVLQDYGITHTTTKVAVGKDRVILWRGSGEVDEKTWEIILSGLASS